MSDASLAAAAATLQGALEAAGEGLVNRRALIDLIALAAVAGEHLLVIGPPGTAKSAAVRRVAGALGGRYFEYLLGRFTEPSEIFGPVDLRRLREGAVETLTTGMLPEAELAFLDEVFLGSTAILNTLLGILNERSFRRGHTRIRVPLRVCVGASNSLPSEGALAAFADRFLLRVFVEPVSDPLLEELLESGWGLEQAGELSSEGMAALELLSAAVRRCDPAPIRGLLADCVRRLRGAGVALSDRRVVKLQKLACAAALLDGRGSPDARDLWPVVYSVPEAAGQGLAREVLREALAASEASALSAAAVEAAQGPAARAAWLAQVAERLLLSPPIGERADVEGWRLRLEGLAREIDAGFSSASLPERLSAVRSQIVAILEEEP